MADINLSRSDNMGVHEDVGQNLVINYDFESAPSFTAATTTGGRWIDGTAGGSGALTSFGWGIPSIASVTATANTQFDTSVSHSGSNSLKLSTLDATGVISSASYVGSTPNGVSGIPARPSSSYSFSVWVKTNNVATNAVWADIREYDSSFATAFTNSTSKLSGTNNWTQLTKTFTTTATTVFFSIIFRNIVAGNVGDAWFDDVSLLANVPSGQVNIQVGVTVSPTIQDVSGPKIWS